MGCKKSRRPSRLQAPTIEFYHPPFTIPLGALRSSLGTNLGAPHFTPGDYNLASYPQLASFSKSTLLSAKLFQNIKTYLCNLCM